jgi:hypothetical protein
MQATSDELAAFRGEYLSSTELAERMSELFWFDVYVLNAWFDIDPHDILDVINELESGEKSTGVKPATPFNNLPLRGLWHKHYFPPALWGRT